MTDNELRIEHSKISEQLTIAQAHLQHWDQQVQALTRKNVEAVNAIQERERANQAVAVAEKAVEGQVEAVSIAKEGVKLAKEKPANGKRKTKV